MENPHEKTTGTLTFRVGASFGFFFSTTFVCSRHPVHLHHSRHFHPPLSKLARRQHFLLYSYFIFNRNLKKLIRDWSNNNNNSVCFQPLQSGPPFNFLCHGHQAYKNISSRLKKGGWVIFTMDSVDSQIRPTCGHWRNACRTLTSFSAHLGQAWLTALACL